MTDRSVTLGPSVADASGDILPHSLLRTSTPGPTPTPRNLSVSRILPVPAPRAPEQLKVAPTVRLPPYTRDDPEGWFYRVEGNFRVAGLTDAVLQADIAINALPEEIYKKVATWLRSLGDPVTFLRLKDKLLETCTASASERASRLMDLALNPRRDGDPRDIMNAIEDLLYLPDTDSYGLRRQVDLPTEIFLRQLRPEVRSQIPDPFSLPRDILVETAHRLTEVVRATRETTAAVSSTNAILLQEVPEDPICAVIKKKPPHHRKEEVPGICHFHKKFGKYAKLCRPPCSFTHPKNGPGGGLPNGPGGSLPGRPPAPTQQQYFRGHGNPRQ